MSLVWIENDSFKKERKVVASLIFLYAIKLIYERRKVEFVGTKTERISPHRISLKELLKCCPIQEERRKV